MAKNPLINIISVLLMMFFFFTSGTSSFASNITTYFGSDATAEDLASESGWDTDALNAAEWEYTSATTQETTTIQRVNPYTEQYYYDIIKTTKEYLGITDSVSGSGGAAMAAVALQEYETWLEESAAGVYHGTQELNGDNDVKYNTWYYGREVSGDAYQWCCVFVSWCANECGFLDDEVLPSYGGKGAAGCTPLLNNLVSNYGYERYSVSSCYPYTSSGYTPVPGDLVFFMQGATSTHIGIVVDIGESGIVVVEGNHSNHVSKTEYAPGLNWPAYFSSGYIVHVEYPATDSVDGVYSWLINAGYTAQGASALIAGMNHECSLWSCREETVTSYTNESGSYVSTWYNRWESAYLYSLSSTPDGLPYGYGLIQWTDNLNTGNKRRTELFTYAEENGYDYQHYNAYTDGLSYALANTYVCLEGQLAFLDHELQTSYARAYSVLTTSTDLSTCLYYVDEVYIGWVAGDYTWDLSTAWDIYNTYNS